MPPIVPGELGDAIHPSHPFEFGRPGGFFDDLDNNHVVSTGEGPSGSVLVGQSSTEHHGTGSGMEAEYDGDHAGGAAGSFPRSNSAINARRRATKNRMYHLSETEKKARHNTHTRNSRLRIDEGLDRLKRTLKKVRPSLKLTKKADIVDEAVRIIREMHALPSSSRNEGDEERSAPSQDPGENGGASSRSM
jgi:hypothetical protein